MYKYLLPLVVLASCSVQKRLEKLAAKDPVALANVCLKNFSVKDSVILRDSVVIDTVSTAIEPFIPDYIDIGEKPGISIDTGVLRRVILRNAKCPPVQVITKTVYRDSIHYNTYCPKEKVLEAALDNAQDEIAAKNNDIEGLQDKLHRCRKINFWLYIIIGACLGYIFRKPIGALLNPIKRFYPF